MKHIARIGIILFAIFSFFLLPAALPHMGISSSNVKAASAPTDWPQLYAGDRDNTADNGSISAPSYNAALNDYTGHYLYCGLGFITVGKYGCTESMDRAKLLLKSSTLANVGSGIAMMYRYPAADFGLWLTDTGSSLGFIPKQAFAQSQTQGIGFNGLTPLLPIWKAFRNIAYALLAFAMVIIGFMVMFRKKIDPKTVVTVQNALPRIVIALILITFSYAIAGLLIDIMNLFLAFVAVVIGGALNSSGATYLPTQSVGAGSGTTQYITGGMGALYRLIMNPLAVVDSASRNLLGVNGDGNNFVSGPLGFIFNEGVALAISTIFKLLISVALLLVFLRVLFMLLNCYVQIILGVLLGPFQILLDVFPGTNGFTGWLQNMVANLAAFPVTLALLLISNVITNNFGSGTLWTPPFIPQTGPDGNFSSEIAKIMITIGVVLAIPGVVGSVKEALKAKPLFSMGGGPSHGGGITQMLSAAYYVRGLGGDWVFKKFFGSGGHDAGGE